MRKIKFLFRYLLWKLRALFGSRALSLTNTPSGSVSDFFSGDGFAAVFLSDYQKKLICRHLLIKNKIRHRFCHELYKVSSAERAELGVVNDSVLSHIAQLYENSLKNSEMILCEPTALDGFLTESLELGRKTYLTDLKSYALEVARNLQGRRVLVLSRSAYLIKTQYSKFEKINPGLSGDFKLLALNPFSEVLVTANGQFFNAFDELKVLILKLDFDVVLLDNSLYALPLAVFASGLGKKALLMGEELLSLFGIVKKQNELAEKNELWAAADSYKDDIGPDFLATGQLPEIK